LGKSKVLPALKIVPLYEDLLGEWRHSSTALVTSALYHWPIANTELCVYKCTDYVALLMSPWSLFLLLLVIVATMKDSGRSEDSNERFWRWVVRK